jgi:hypothetical protein
MRLAMALIFVVTGGWPQIAMAEVTPGPPGISNEQIPLPRFWDIFTNLPEDMVLWWQGTFSKENIPELAGVLGATAVMIPSDYETWQAVYHPAQEHGNLYAFFRAGDEISGGIFQVGLSAIFLSWGIFGNHRALRTAYQIAESVLSSGIVVQVMKRATGRESPRSSLAQGGYWNGYPGEQVYQSRLRDFDAMPSGHLSSAFVVFEVVRRNYPEQTWMPWVGYPTMAIFALSCVGDNIHWFSDFPIAIALAYSFARIVTDRNQRGHTDIAAGRPPPPIGTRWNDPLVSLGQSRLTGEPLLTAGWEF